MSKRTRQQKKEEEKRIIAEMQDALLQQADEDFSNTKTDEKPRETDGEYRLDMNDPTPRTIHCKRCKTLMENGVCPTCGWKVYVPMDKKKRDKIRLIVTGVLMVAFVIIFVIIQARG